MKALYSERNGLPTNKVKTDIIHKDIYQFILDCCDKYHINLAAAFPQRYNESSRIWGVDEYRFHAEVKYRIPIFYEDNYRFRGWGYRRFKPKYNQYALLDYVEFIAQNIRSISSTKEYKYDGTAYEFQEHDDGLTAKDFVGAHVIDESYNKYICPACKDCNSKYKGDNAKGHWFKVKKSLLLPIHH